MNGPLHTCLLSGMQGLSRALEMDGEDEPARFSALERPPVSGEEDGGLQRTVM